MSTSHEAMTCATSSHANSWKVEAPDIIGYEEWGHEGEEEEEEAAAVAVAAEEEEESLFKADAG